MDTARPDSIHMVGGSETEIREIYVQKQRYGHVRKGVAKYVLERVSALICRNSGAVLTDNE